MQLDALADVTSSQGKQCLLMKMEGEVWSSQMCAWCGAKSCRMEKTLMSKKHVCFYINHTISVIQSLFLKYPIVFTFNEVQHLFSVCRCLNERLQRGTFSLPWVSKHVDVWILETDSLFICVSLIRIIIIAVTRKTKFDFFPPFHHTSILMMAFALIFCLSSLSSFVVLRFCLSSFPPPLIFLPLLTLLSPHLFFYHSISQATSPPLATSPTGCPPPPLLML